MSDPSFGTCSKCGDEFQVTGDDDDPFTSISVHYHDEDREKWAESYCQGCGDEILEGLDAHDGGEADE